MSQSNEPDTTEANETEEAASTPGVPGRFSLFTKLILCLIVVFVADVVFYDAQIGWMSGLFFLMLGGMVMYVHGGGHERMLGWLSMGWLICTSVSLVISVTPLSFLLGTVSLLALYSIRRFSRTDHAFSFMRSLSRDTVQLLFSPVLDSFSMIAVVRRMSSTERGSVSSKLRGIFSRGLQWFFEWVIPAGLFVVFLFLFSLANPIFSSVFLPLRILFWIVIGVLVWGLLRLPRSVLRLPAVPGPTSFGLNLFPRMSPGAVSRSLLMFNLLFLIQNGLDVMYLWGGRSLPEGMTYAEYAHRGSYPLVVTALLAAFFVLISFRSGEKPGRMKWARRLVYLWIVQNIFLLGSAAWRLWLYVDFYGLSRWRVSTVIWMFLVAAGFVYILIRIAGGLSNRWLINISAVTAVVILTMCTFVNVDRRIAEYNVRHCKEVNGDGTALDINYLRNLGPDALPALKWVRPRLESRRKKERVSDAFRSLSARLLSVMNDWRGYTYQRARLLKAIEGERLAWRQYVPANPSGKGD